MSTKLFTLLECMHKNFEINPTQIKGGCQSVRKVVTHNSKSDLPLAYIYKKKYFVTPTKGSQR